MGIPQRLNAEVADIIDYLKISYPEHESVLVGCRAETPDSYECCEYDIIVLQKEQDGKSVKKTKNYNLHKLNGKTLEIIDLNKEDLTRNASINFLNYINLTGSDFKSNFENCFELKKRQNIKNFVSHTKRKSAKFALDCTEVSKQIVSDTFDQKLSSLYLKMMSFSVLELFIQLFLKDYPRPTHLKYQINHIKENNLKIKESFDIVLEYLQLERSNISTITRSEKSLLFLLAHKEHRHHHVYNRNVGEILGSKLNYLKKQSMYVDANLLIQCFVGSQNFDANYIKNYNRLLNQILDVQIKEKIILLKEIETLFNINKSFIKNVY